MFKRLYTILKANVEHRIHAQGAPLNEHTHSSAHQHESTFDEFSSEKSSPHNRSDNQQLIDDLAHFGLQPPSSLKEVTAARNREMLKFHPDKFASDSEKAKVANEIALIYNAAYDRLKVHFSK